MHSEPGSGPGVLAPPWMLRLFADNGNLDDNILMHILPISGLSSCACLPTQLPTSFSGGR
jgi:hypothetical protein